LRVRQGRQRERSDDEDQRDAGQKRKYEQRLVVLQDTPARGGQLEAAPETFEH
jgi:hypothetical protein